MTTPSPIRAAPLMVAALVIGAVACSTASDDGVGSMPRDEAMDVMSTPASPSTDPPVTTSSAPASSSATHVTGTSLAPEPTTGTLTSSLEFEARELRQTCGAPAAVVGVRDRAGHMTVVADGRLADDLELTPDSAFFAGSVTKLVVAAVVLQLIDEGRLSIDEPIGRWVDWPRSDEITVDMLLSHRSGMGDYGNDFSAAQQELVLADLARSFTYDEVLDMVRAVPMVAEPGAGYHYSNANYIVLGAIIRQLTGMSLGAALESRVLAPAGLSDTFYGPDDLARLDSMTYRGLFDIRRDGDPIEIGLLPRTAAFTVDPAGSGLVSTAPDMLALIDALFAGSDLLSPAAAEYLGTHVSTIDAEALLLDDGRRIVGHGGASPGAQVVAAHDLDTGVSTVAWCNRLDPGPQELLPTVAATRRLLLLPVAVDGSAIDG